MLHQPGISRRSHAWPRSLAAWPLSPLLFSHINVLHSGMRWHGQLWRRNLSSAVACLSLTSANRRLAARERATPYSKLARQRGGDIKLTACGRGIHQNHHC